MIYVIAYLKVLAWCAAIGVMLSALTATWQAVKGLFDETDNSDLSAEGMPTVRVGAGRWEGNVWSPFPEGDRREAVSDELRVN